MKGPRGLVPARSIPGARSIPARCPPSPLRSCPPAQVLCACVLCRVLSKGNAPFPCPSLISSHDGFNLSLLQSFG